MSSQSGSERSQQRGRLGIIVVGGLIFMLTDIVFCRDNAFEEHYNLLLWNGFFPVIVVALLYFISVAAPRMARDNGRELDCRPVLWHSFSILGSLFFGLLMVFMVRGSLVACMDLFNKTPVQVESVILGIGRSKHCRVKMDLTHKCSICLHYIGHQPLQTPWPLDKMTTDEAHKLAGRKVVLVGRKSFAGTVIDEIRLPSDQ
jgi:uncharacterized integral membrane protein